MTDIRVSEENKQKLALIKRKKHLTSLNDVVGTLLNDETAGSEPAETRESAKSPTMEPIIQDVCPDCIDFIRCTHAWIRDPQKVKAARCFKPRAACIFRTDDKDGKISCAKDYAKTGRIHNITKEDCQACWKEKLKLFRVVMDMPTL